MLHAKFQDHRTSGSGEEDFLKVFTIYGRDGHLGHVTWTIYINLGSPFQRRLHMKFGFDWPGRAVSEDEMLKMVNDNDNNDTGAWYTISSPMSLRLR